MRRLVWMVSTLAVLSLLGCEEDGATEPVGTVASEGEPSLDDWVQPGAGDPHAAGPPEQGASPHATGGAAPGLAPEGQPSNVRAVQGTIRERADAAGYTYFRVETEGGDVWIAAMQPTVDVGDEVTAVGTLMTQFRSNALDRTFPELLLAGRVDEGSGPAAGAPAGPHGGAPSPHGGPPPGHGGAPPPGHGGMPSPHGGAPPSGGAPGGHP